MKKHTLISIFLVILGLLLFAGCTPGSPENGGDDKTVIAVSIPPESTFVKAVAGDDYEIVTMVPSGNSPANYEPTPALKEKFAQAAIYFSIGVPTEANNILPYVAEGTRIVSLNDAAAQVYDELLLDGERDPHVWLSPKRVIVMIQTIRDELSLLDPAGTDTYEANAAAYIAQLEELDTLLKEMLAGVTNHKFIVFHPAFGYLADDYGLEMYALEEEGKEATAAHMQEVIDLAKEEGIKVIFYQAEIDSHQSEAFAEELNGKTVMLDPLSEDYVENMKLMVNTMAEVME